MCIFMLYIIFISPLSMGRGLDKPNKSTKAKAWAHLVNPKPEGYQSTNMSSSTKSFLSLPLFYTSPSFLFHSTNHNTRAIFIIIFSWSESIKVVLFFLFMKRQYPLHSCPSRHAILRQVRVTTQKKKKGKKTRAMQNENTIKK